MKYIPVNDLAVRVVLTPPVIDNRNNSALVLRVRAKDYISTAALHVSCDGESYLQICDCLDAVVGGTLLQPLTNSPETIQIGPQIKIQGPDAARLRVLSNADWQLGRMPMLLGEEWCFVQQLVAAGGDRYRPYGILRGQMGSKVTPHPYGAQVFLGDSRAFQPIRDSAFRPRARIWVKTQPVASDALPLTSARAWEFVLPDCYTSEEVPA